MNDPCIVSGQRRVPLRQIAQHAQQGASGLASLGIGSGDRVALMMRNDIPFFEAYQAVAQLGAYPVPVNWHFTADEAGYILQDSGAKALIAHADMAPILREAAPSGLPIFWADTPVEIAQAYQVAESQRAIPAGAPAWASWIVDFAPRPVATAEPPGAMIYTSGTTGRPKGVRRQPPTAVQALAALKTGSRAFGFYDRLVEGKGDPKTVIINGPMYHSAPLAYAMMAYRSGSTIVLQARFEPEDLLRLVHEHRATNMHMVPTMFVRLLKVPAETRARYDLSSLRHVVHGAAPCPPDVKRAMIDWWGPVIHEYYGATETGAIVIANSQEWLAHPGSVGRPQTDVELLIIGDDGTVQPAGQPGEVYARLKTGGDFTYHGDDAKRARAERDGLITVGDIGYLDADGFLYLCDRRNHMVISGGVNIYPAEIEAELLKIPGIADCAVFGIPDVDFGEALAAHIQREPGSGLTEAAIRERLSVHLSRYKIPKIIAFETQLPREDSGKIFKRKLREPYWEGQSRRI